MDEVETAQALGKLRVLVTHISDPDVANAFKIVLDTLHGLSERITELQMEDDDD